MKEKGKNQKNGEHKVTRIKGRHVREVFMRTLDIIVSCIHGGYKLSTSSKL
jgi:hypothetical protein